MKHNADASTWAPASGTHPAATPRRTTLAATALHLAVAAASSAAFVFIVKTAASA